MGRTVLPEDAYQTTPLAAPEFARRREVLRETIAALAEADPPDFYHRLAAANLKRWSARTQAHAPSIEVVPGDWGQVCGEYTRRHGRCFAALNMASAYKPGGAYVEGKVAQEENMFRRTDCHFALDAREFDQKSERYLPERTALINGEGGRVLLDTAPRVCVRGPEDRSDLQLGYAWLPEDEVFPFFELRAAADELRGGRRFEPARARAKIDAQLDTLIDANVRHAVLGAFGCGAFHNPADQVARIYAEALRERDGAFDCVVFAIFDAGYGPDNYIPFARVFGPGGPEQVRSP